MSPLNLIAASRVTPASELNGLLHADKCSLPQALKRRSHATTTIGPVTMRCKIISQARDHIVVAWTVLITSVMIASGNVRINRDWSPI